MSSAESSWIDIRPALTTGCRAEEVFLRFARELASFSAEGGRRDWGQLSRLRTEAIVRAEALAADSVRMRLIVSSLCDLVAKGWEFRFEGGSASLKPPGEGVMTDLQNKARVRESLLVERDSQLRQPSVQVFVKEMEKRRLGPRGWSSVFSLIRDGPELSQKLRAANDEKCEDARLEALRRAIDPYLQFVREDTTCEFTGLRLLDIWRYFRHTWVTPYSLPPGRKVLILVRDRAAENHPVVGIAALANAVVQLLDRDEWIGWTTEAFLGRLQYEASDAWARWLAESVEELFASVYVEDLLSDGLVTESDLKEPTAEAIKRLRGEARKARVAHGQDPEIAAHKLDESRQARPDWGQRAKMPLFRSKRAGLLAKALQVRLLLSSAGFRAPTSDDLRRALESPLGREAIGIVLRRVKAGHVGVNMLDIVVCGAVAPYQAVLGGKLVAMLLTSPEVRCEYERRYQGTASVIASSIAGRPISRPPHLVLLGTTSLYGVGSSMYNRIVIPAEAIGGEPGSEIRYEKLGYSVGFGSVQFSPETINEIEAFINQSARHLRVNSIFGEGVSPRLRKMRSGLDLVGLPSDLLLQHGNPRIVYGIPLAEAFRDVLLGLREKVPYTAPSNDPVKTTQLIVEFWMRRWLSGRIRRLETLQEVERQSLCGPAGHDALVKLPRIGDEMALFRGFVD